MENKTETSRENGKKGGRPKEDEANARLISAAPELLDALKKLVGWYDCFQLKEGEADLPVIVKSRAAIAKAENTTC
jgi:hypothetical protein